MNKLQSDAYFFCKTSSPLTQAPTKKVMKKARVTYLSKKEQKREGLEPEVQSRPK
jgi:hypothetical protein